MSLKLDLLKVDNWAQLPNPWKSVKKVSKVNYTNNIEDKGLAKIVVPYCSTDDLRPAMTGVNFSSTDIVATNAHYLICLPAKNAKEGLYMLNPSFAKKGGTKLYSKMDDKYPDYKAILSSQNSVVTEVDIYKLKTYCQAVINGQYCNKYTKEVIFLVESGTDGFNIGFNAELLITVLDSFLMLGHDRIFVGFSSNRRAATFSTEKDAARNPYNSVGVSPIAICMPLMVDNFDLLGAREEFYSEMNVYYSFQDNEIHNADKSIARFDYDLNSKEIPYMDESSLKLLSKVAGKSKILPILDDVAVEDGVARATDLTTTISISNVNIEDGCYFPINGALKGKIDADKLDDFPKNSAIINMDNFLGDIDASILRKYISDADKFIGDDELRPAMMGVNFKIGNGKLEIAATNAFVLYTITISSNIKELDVIVPNPKFLSEVLDAMGDKMVSIYYDSVGRIQFSDGLITVSFKVIDSKYPDYKSVITTETDKALLFNKSELLSIIGSLNSADLKKTLVFNFGNEAKNSGISDLFIVDKYDNNTEVYQDEKHIGRIKCDVINKDSINDENVSLIMGKSGGQYSEIGFCFDPKYLKTLLSINNDNVSELLFKDSQKNYKQFLQKLNTIQPKAKIVKETKVEIVEPNTDDEFNEMVFEQIEPSSKEGDVKAQISKIVKGATDKDIDDLVKNYNKWLIKNPIISDTKVAEKVEIKTESSVDTKADALAAIKGLQILADRGNAEAIATIKSLRFLI